MSTRLQPGHFKAKLHCFLFTLDTCISNLLQLNMQPLQGAVLQKATLGLYAIGNQHAVQKYGNYGHLHYNQRLLLSVTDTFCTAGGTAGDHDGVALPDHM